MKENEEDEILEELEEGEAFVEELDDGETEETTGGSWGPTETWDFSRLTGTHYLYVSAGTYRDSNGTKWHKWSERKLLTGLGKKKVRAGKKLAFGTGGHSYGAALNGKTMVHVDIVGVGKRLYKCNCLQ